MKEANRFPDACVRQCLLMMRDTGKAKEEYFVHDSFPC